MNFYNSNSSNNAWLNVTIASELRKNTFPMKTLIKIPNGNYGGYTFGIATERVTEAADEMLNICIGADEAYKLHCNGKDDVTLSGIQLYNALVGKATATQSNPYHNGYTEIERSVNDEEPPKKKFYKIILPKNAKAYNLDKVVMFCMPDGEYKGYRYGIPKPYVKETDADITFALPEDFTINAKTTKDAERNFTVKELKDITDNNKTYTIKEYKPPFAKKEEQFNKQAAVLRNTIPEEMKKRPNWVVVRTRKYNDELVKSFISPVTGNYAEMDNPETWADFETACAYGKEHLATTLAYALDGKDKICCLDISDALDEQGKLTDKSKMIMYNFPDTYAEKSIGGKDVHLFAKSEGLNVRPFSEADDAINYYKKNHFVIVTGNVISKTRAIESFDGKYAQNFLKSRFAAREELECGILILMPLGDREILEEAFKSNGGETFKDLFYGKDLGNSYDASITMLANRICVCCNKRNCVDKREQMLRILVASGFYRSDKPVEYYELIVIKAINTYKRLYKDGNKK